MRRIYHRPEGIKLTARKISRVELQQAVDLVTTHKTACAAAKVCGVPTGTLTHRFDAAMRAGIKPSASAILPGEIEVVRLRGEVRDLQAQIAAFHRETLDDRLVRERILNLAAQTPNPPGWLIEPLAKKHTAGVPTLFASDWHWGEVVDAAQVNGVNAFDMDVAQKRAHTMINTAVDLLTNHLVSPRYPGIVLALGGDMVSGDIHEELSATNEKEIMPVVLDVFGVLVWCIETLADKFGNVFVPCVSGNHGRNTRKTRAKGRNFTSFDWLIYCFLERHFKGDKRVTFMIPSGSDAYYRIYDHRYLLSHGDQFRGGDGMIGALGPIIRGDHKKRSRNSQIDMAYDTLMVGHWHQLMQLERLIVNGSLKGYDEYAYTSNFGFEPPKQALWVTHPQHGITVSWPVHLDDTHISHSTWSEWMGK